MQHGVLKHQPVCEVPTDTSTPMGGVRVVHTHTHTQLHILKQTNTYTQTHTHTYRLLVSVVEMLGNRN